MTKVSEYATTAGKAVLFAPLQFIAAIGVFAGCLCWFFMYGFKGGYAEMEEKHDDSGALTITRPAKFKEGDSD